MLAEAQRLKSTFTVCLIDVDHFKKVNDTYGHLAGDKVLAGLGQLLSRRFRVDDLRGRWGGEEFILAFRRESRETMHAAIMRVLDEFASMTFVSDDGQDFHVSFSGGIASYPDDGDSVYQLVQTADKRLYEAKHAGRRCVFAMILSRRQVTSLGQAPCSLMPGPRSTAVGRKPSRGFIDLGRVVFAVVGCSAPTDPAVAGIARQD